MKTLLKALVACVIVVALALGGGYWFLTQKADEAAGSAVSSVTGSDEVGALAEKVMSGEDLTDAEIQQGLGVDGATYQKVKEAAASAGIDLNDSQQLRSIAVKNADKAPEAQEIVDQVRSGALTEKEAAAKLEALVQK